MRTCHPGILVERKYDDDDYYYYYYYYFFTRGRYDPSGGIIVIIAIIMSGRSGLVHSGQKCALKSNKIETLNADGKPLEEKRGFTFITSGQRSAITNLANEIQCRPIV